MKQKGVLYLVATPIGHLSDITLRALEVLKTVDVIAAEDTRHSKRLLDFYGINKKLLSYHEHNEARQTQTLIGLLQSGKSIALISDAGTPLISDPGFLLVREAKEKGIAVVPIPGACAAIAALSVSGLSAVRFIFEGFLPPKRGQRQKRLKEVSAEPRTLVFYESCHRILHSLKDMSACFGENRQAVVAREITKIHETILSGTLQELATRVEQDAQQQKGEFVIIIEGLGFRRHAA